MTSSRTHLLLTMASEECLEEERGGREKGGGGRERKRGRRDRVGKGERGRRRGEVKE